MNRRWKIGTRGSDLALAQVALVRRELESRFPGIALDTIVVATTGDVRQDLPLGDPKSGVDKGIFTRELEGELLAERVDFVVHSLKDVPTEVPAGLEIAGTLMRAGTEDVLLSRAPVPDGLASLPPGSIVATSSVRRRFQVLRLCPDCEVRPVRGNVPTRLAKLAAGAGGISALLLARAGLERLGWNPVSGEVAAGTGLLYASILSREDLLPAAAQGAIGLQIRTGDTEAAELVHAITHQPSWRRVRCEREFLRLLDAGCHTPIGIRTEIQDDGRLRAAAVVFAEDGQSSRASRALGPADDPEALARILFDSLIDESPRPS